MYAKYINNNVYRSVDPHFTFKLITAILNVIGLKDNLQYNMLPEAFLVTKYSLM